MAGLSLTTFAPGGTPAAAQAALGLTIDVTQGAPGSQVHGQVSVADVAAGCTTDVLAFRDGMIDMSGAIDTVIAEDDLLPSGTTIDTFPQLSAGLISTATAGTFISDAVRDEVFAQTFVMTFARSRRSNPSASGRTSPPEWARPP